MSLTLMRPQKRIKYTIQILEDKITEITEKYFTVGFISKSTFIAQMWQIDSLEIFTLYHIVIIFLH